MPQYFGVLKLYTASSIPQEVRHAQQLQPRFQGGHRCPDAAAPQRTHASIARETGISVTTLRVCRQRALGEQSLQTQSGGDQTPSLSHRFQIAF